MKKKLFVTMPDGSVWTIPVDAIARNRAAYFAGEFGGDIEKSLSEDTEPLFDADEFEVEDWAKNNMNWCDIKHCAIRIKAPDEPDYSVMWAEAEMEVRRPDFNEMGFYEMRGKNAK